MRLTRGCGYALRALEYLAERGDGRPATARKIAEARGAPKRFLLRPLKALVSAGLLRSAAGPAGGYRLGRPVSRITLLEVVEAVDGPVRGDAPRVGEGGGLDSRLGAVCERVAEEVRRRLGQVRLSDLAGKSRPAPPRPRGG
ncbi:MAG TPA: Rrf2 family transcriptional regulator [Gemmataceae bacterium]|jgi:Rrf2 family protein|nr:Rrf2 family transcriptional regulator [Gemmataceae bacterium]